MTSPTLFGARYSVYTRIARLALLEKGVAHRFEEIDIFGEVPPAYLARHPFKRIPALEHGELALYETAAITRYVDEAFAGPDLQPADPALRARMTQIVGLIDHYLYWPAVRVIFVERVGKPAEGEAGDEAAIEAALPQAARALAALAALVDPGPWLLGDRLSLADLHLAPNLDYFRRAPEGERLLAAQPKLADWWEEISGRESWLQTPFVRS